uniref:5-hydroxytryptamine receptor 3D n=1 Tax=Rousettus aegyptiacus TaxID=9407 RepID=A0A7J8HR63_ROUAE|nr:5-hydroxytryptamine receptor 3D [Rousettus aegyptiacus]
MENMVLGMEEEVQKILSTSQNLIQSKGEWMLLGIHQRKMKMTVNAHQYNQIVFYVTIRRRPRLYVINFLMPSGFLVAVDALSFYLPAESKTRVPFKMTPLLGYNVFPLIMNDLFSKSGILLISRAPPSFRRIKARSGSEGALGVGGKSARSPRGSSAT